MRERTKTLEAEQVLAEIPRAFPLMLISVIEMLISVIEMLISVIERWTPCVFDRQRA
jgi:hypothetical protein